MAFEESCLGESDCVVLYFGFVNFFVLEVVVVVSGEPFSLFHFGSHSGVAEEGV